jgi:mannose-6-phosphate isomerase-like protein (cupin superfamily)
MSAYTFKNLKHVEDSAPGFGFAPDIEARFARDELECEKGAVGYFRLAPGKRFPFGHRQKQQEEIYVVLGGSGRMKVAENIVALGPLDAVRVPPQTARGIEAGPEGLEYIVFGAPHTGPGDGELVEAWWPE